MPMMLPWIALLWPEGPAWTSRGFAADTAILPSAFPPNEVEGLDFYSDERLIYRTSGAKFSNKPYLETVMEAPGGSAGQLNGYFTSQASASFVFVANFGTRVFSNDRHMGPIDDSAMSTKEWIYMNAAEEFRFGRPDGASVLLGAGDLNAHLFIVVMRDSANETVYIDGTQVYDGAYASYAPRMLILGHGTLGNSALGTGGGYALAGVVPGNIAGYSNYGDFKSWVSSHYGITVA